MYNKYIDLLKQQRGEEPYLDEVALNYYEIGELEKARETLAEDTDPYWHLYTEILIESKEGNVEVADSLLRSFIMLPEEQIKASTVEEDLAYHYIHLAILYASNGAMDQAFESLDKGWAQLLTRTEYLWEFPEFKKLHKDPRWQQLLDRLGGEFNFDYNAD